MDKGIEIKNDKQIYFNQIKGLITELNDGEKYCSITLEVGHENTRNVNLVLKKAQFDSLCNSYKKGDKITLRFFLSSRFKNGRWYTMANVLGVVK
jgi:hypothetical protein